MNKPFNYSVCSTLTDNRHSTRFCVHGTVYEEFSYTTAHKSVPNNERIHNAFRIIKDTFTPEHAEQVLLKNFTFNVEHNSLRVNGNVSINLNATDSVALDVHEKLKMTIGEFRQHTGADISSMMIKALQTRAHVLLSKLAEDELSDEKEWR